MINAKNNTSTLQEKANNTKERNEQIKKASVLRGELKKEFTSIKRVLAFGVLNMGQFETIVTTSSSKFDTKNFKGLKKNDFTAKNLFEYAQENTIFASERIEPNNPDNMKRKFIVDKSGNKIKKESISLYAIETMARNILKERNNIK